MQEFIKINMTNAQQPTVSGRELHQALGIETRYNDWFRRMCEYGFTENEDFYSILSKTSDGGRPSVDHQLTIDMAKELCMIQRTDIGRSIRQYFIRVEKERHQYSPMLQELMAILALWNMKYSHVSNAENDRSNIDRWCTSARLTRKGALTKISKTQDAILGQRLFEDTFRLLRTCSFRSFSMTATNKSGSLQSA